MSITAQSRSILGRLQAQQPEELRGALGAVANGKPGAAEALSAKTGIPVAELRAAAELSLNTSLDKLFAQTTDAQTVATTGADKPKAFQATAGGVDPRGLMGLQYKSADVADVSTLAVKGGAQDFSAQNAAPAYGVQGGPRGELGAVPSSRDLLSVRSGDAKPADVAKALKEALLSGNPAVVKKAARTMQVVESYQRKAEADAKNYAGTGFVPFRFPKLDLQFSKEETAKLINAVATTRDPATVDIVMMTVKRGVVSLADSNAVLGDARLKALGTGASGELPRSDGKETPRGEAKSFHDEWVNEVEPGMRNIREVIIQTAAARGASCPFSRGNHAKGVEFENVAMKTSEQAPDWVKDLFGSVVKGGMIRVSGSQTNPDEPDSKPHQPGVRITLPLKGKLEDGSASQILDITANSGETTHANTARKHTNFTKSLSLPPEGGLLDSQPVRIAKFLAGGAAKGEFLEEIGQIRSALGATKKANQEPFNEHDLYARHAYFIDGRYVQIRLKVVEPNDFPNPVNDPNPNARLDAVANTVAARGMKVAMYLTEIPQGKAELAEVEGWKGLRATEFLAGTFEVPRQQVSDDSAAHKYMQEHSFIPAGEKMVATGVGLGRHRTAVYQASQDQRLEHRPGT